jgi:DNA-binding CsgD family transcriptional regulator
VDKTRDTTRATPMLTTPFSAFLEEAFEAEAMPQLGRSFFALAEHYGYTATMILDGEKLGGELRPALLFATNLKSALTSWDRKQPFSRNPIYKRSLDRDSPFDLEELSDGFAVPPPTRPQLWPPSIGQVESLSLPVHRAQRLVMFIGVAGARPDGASLCRATLHTAAHVVYDRFVHFSRRDTTHRSLTNREAECMRWIGLGKTDREIGEIVGISERTVRYHASNAKAKLGVTTRVEAIAKMARAARSKRK